MIRPRHLLSAAPVLLVVLLALSLQQACAW
jgi:hypothetical protein